MKIDSLIKKKSALTLSYLLVLAVGFIYSIFLHYTLGMDAFWDTANYHLFIGWAALNLSPYDFGAAAQFHTYLNPLIDIVNYKTFTTHPYIGAAFHSFVLALTIFSVYLIAKSSIITDKYKLSTISAVAIGATGAMTVSLFGSFTNEHVVALFVLSALLITVKNIETGGTWAFIIAGIFIGFSVGLKLTVVPYAIGLFATISVCSKFNLRIISSSFIGIGLGFLLADGLFMALRFEAVGNPFFPLANNIFKSPYFPSEWKSFSSFELEKTTYYLSLPFIWLTAGDFSEANNIRDGRFLLAYIGLALIFIASLQKKTLTTNQFSVVFFFLASWLSWILIFRIYRYLIPLEFLSGVIFLIGLSVFFGPKNYLVKTSAILTASCFLYFITVYPDWGRRAWQDEFYKSDLIDVIGENSADVVFYADQRLSYLSPQLKSSNIPFRNLFSQPWYDSNRYGNPIDPKGTIISSKSNVYFLQYYRANKTFNSRYLKSLFGDDIYSCKEVHTNMPYNPFLCSFKKPSDISFPTVSIGKTYNYDTEKVLFLDGWSGLESGHIWSDGYKSSIVFKMDALPKNCSAAVTISGDTLGEQLVLAYINGTEVYKQNLNGPFESSINLGRLNPTVNNIIKLDLKLPNATTLNNGDPRFLAVSLRSLNFDCRR